MLQHVFDFRRSNLVLKTHAQLQCSVFPCAFRFAKFHHGLRQTAAQFKAISPGVIAQLKRHI